MYKEKKHYFCIANKQKTPKSVKLNGNNNKSK